MIFTDKSAREKITTLEARVSELEADLVLKDTAIDAHAAEISERDQTIAEHVSTIASRDEKITELTGKITELETKSTESAQKITDLEASAADVDKLAAIKASELLAAQGHPAPVSLVESGKTDEEKPDISNLTGFAKVSAAFAKKK
jgi:uncharacterized protein (DUF3084 family)